MKIHPLPPTTTASLHLLKTDAMQVLFTFLLSLGLLVGLLLVLRRPVRWYLGIDTHLQNQRDIITLLSALSGGGLQTTAGPDNRQKPEKSGRNRRRRRPAQQRQSTDDSAHA